MEHLLVIALAIALFASLKMGGWHYEVRIVRVAARQSVQAPEGFQWNTPPAKVQPITPPAFESDIVSALVNLGCKKEKAVKVAKLAASKGSFDEQLTWALQNAA